MNNFSGLHDSKIPPKSGTTDVGGVVRGALALLSCRDALAGLERRDFSAVELTQACLDNIAAKDGQIKAFITATAESALAQARTADEHWARGEARELEGLPIAIKDNILQAGVKMTCGSKALWNYVAPYDAAVIEKLRAAGAVLLGKTNLDEFAMGSSTETSYFGPTKNPHDTERVPGGSSGGSAAALAAGMCLAALGSDTGGSIRQPASFCGVLGLKPTYGRVSRYGLSALASSLDQIGPLTRTAEDAELLLGVLAGRDERDATSVEADWLKKPRVKKCLTVGVPEEITKWGAERGEQGLDREVLVNFEKFLARAEEAGQIKVKSIKLPCLKYALACYYVLMPAEASSNLARYDGLRYGYHDASAEDIESQYLNQRTEGFGLEVKRRIMLGTFVLSAGYYDAYYQQAQNARRAITAELESVLREVDLIATPTTPTAAFKLGEKNADPLSMYLSDIFTVPANLAGLPALSLPIANLRGLPLGLQLIGPAWSEKMLLTAAGRMEGLIVI